MTTALLIIAGVLLVVAFVVGILVGRKSVTPGGEPTPQSANAVAIETMDDAEEAARAAEFEADKKAKEALHASDDDTRARVERLRARGRAGE